MTKTMQMVLAMAMVVTPMARPQQATVQPAVADSGDDAQAPICFIGQPTGKAN